MVDQRLVVPRSTIPGTKEWTETVIANARKLAKFAENDVRPLTERYLALCEHQAWEVWLKDEPKTPERFFREALGLDVDFLEAMQKGVAILDGIDGPIPRAVAQRVAQYDGKTINSDAGRPTREEKANLHNMQITDGGVHGTNADYLTRRIVRDHSDIAARMKAGEFRSVYAAAREAGIVKFTRSVRMDDPDSAARTLRKFMTPEARLHLADLLRT